MRAFYFFRTSLRSLFLLDALSWLKGAPLDQRPILAQIGNPERMQLVTYLLDADQALADVAPDAGLYHIPYSTYDAAWLAVSPVRGVIESGQKVSINLEIGTAGLTLPHYFAYLLVENNQPASRFRVIPIHLNLTTTAVQMPVSQALPQTFELEQNFPNPFQGNGRDGAETTMKYQLPQVADVTIRIFNMLGQEVVTLDFPAQMPGFHQVRWNGQLPDGRYAASGLYFFQVQAGPFHSTKKMLLVY